MEKAILLLGISAYFFVQGMAEDVDSKWPIHEFRGVWIATVANIDWPTSSHLTTDQQKASLISALDELQRLNFNAVVFQVRPSGDAFYHSSLEPWSAYLTGTQGQGPSPYYDPLEFLVQEAHDRHIEVHAWFNPFRGRSGSTSRSGLANSHPCIRFPAACYAYGKDLWLDPGDPKVMNHTFDVFVDVIKRYDIDGIHIDDYFYPYPVNGQDFPDSVTYAAYKHGGGRLSLHDWRRNNINTLVHELSLRTKQIKPYVKFGISPFGIWRPGNPPSIHGLDAYDTLYADSRKWLQVGWVDYLTPQLYWKIDQVAQSYTTLLDWWCNQNPKHRHIYTGNYASAIDTHNWSVGEIERQVSESRKRFEVNSLGNVFFSGKMFWNNVHNIATEFSSNVYDFLSLSPHMPWLHLQGPQPIISHVNIQNRHLTWQVENANDLRALALYKMVADAYNLTRILPKNTRSFEFDASYETGTYAIRAVDRLSKESPAHEFSVGSNTILSIG